MNVSHKTPHRDLVHVIVKGESNFRHPFSTHQSILCRKFSRASSHNNSTKNHHHSHHHQQHPHQHNHTTINNNDVDMPEVNSSTGHHPTIKQETNHDQAYDSDEREHEGDPAVDLSTQN